MMAKNFWIMSIQMIVKNSGLINKNLQLFVFGSVLTKSDPRDIDLLLVYNSQSLKISDVINIRKKLRKILQKEIHKSIDICILSESEAVTNPFIKEENAIKIFG